MGSQIFVRMIPLPIAARAVTLPNDDGTFDIYINANLPPEMQVRALEHELEHINQDHFYNEDPVGMNELEAG
jgi:Zn-dependent peptidase ImmA (M78 family)